MVVAVACSSSKHGKGTDAAVDVPITDAPVDAFVPDAPPMIATGDPHTAIPCLRADATSVYWSSGFVPSYVWKSPLGGGSAALLATDQNENACVRALDATNVYYTDGAGGLYGVPVDGGSAALRGPYSLGYVTTNGQYVVAEFYNTGTELWITPVGDASAQAWSEYIGLYALSNLAADATYTYFTGETAVSGVFSIARASIGSDFNPTVEMLYTPPDGVVLGGGMPLYPSQVPTAPYALDAQNLYIVQQLGSNGVTQIVQRAITGSAAPVALVDNQLQVAGIAVDSTDVYWSAMNGSDSAVIQRVPIGGGPVTTVATNTSGTFALAPSHVVYSVPGAIQVVPK